MLLLVLLIVGVGCEEAGISSCSPDALLACAYPTTVEHGIRFAMSEEELDKNCPHLHAGLRCIDNFTRECLRPAQRSAFYRLYSGAGMVLQEICTPGHYRDQFLSLAPCVNNVTHEYMECAGRYEKALRRLRGPVGEEICGELKDYVDCSEGVVREVCGEEAAAFTAGFLHRMTESMFVEHCPVKESAASALHAIPLLASLLAIIIIYIMP